MGEPLLVGTPSDGTVNTDKLASNAVTNAKVLLVYLQLNLQLELYHLMHFLLILQLLEH